MVYPSPGSVSYTHLDVYKRQAVRCAGECLGDLGRLGHIASKGGRGIEGAHALPGGNLIPLTLSLIHILMTGTLLLLLEIRASPRSNWVMLRISVRVSFRPSLTYSASSGSRFRIIFVFELLRMDLP